MSVDVSFSAGRVLKVPIVLMVVCLVGAVSAISSPAAHAIEPKQVTSLPDCSFKIDRTQTGVAIKELPDRLNNGSWLYVKCLVDQQPQFGWEARTELIGADWKLNGKFAKTGDFISAREYRGDGSIVVELEGYVPKNRVIVTANEEKDYLGQVDSYTREIAPPREILVVSLADDRTKDVKHKVNVWAIHPLTADIEAEIAELERNPSSYSEILIARAGDLSNEGRPWAALSFIDSVTPVLDSIETSNEEIRRELMALEEENERLKVELLEEREQQQRFLSVMIGGAVILLLLGIVIGYFATPYLDFLPFHPSRDNDF